MDGREVARILRADPPTATMPSITHSASDNLRARMREMRADG